jgi:hypothetical protein
MKYIYRMNVTHMSSQVRGNCLALSLLFVSPQLCFAQVGTASLSGVISDPTGAAVPNAELTLQSTEGATTRTTKARADGAYVLPSLQPGSYALTVHAQGFEDHKTKTIELSSGQEASLNVALSLAGATTSVTVDASAPVVQTTSASIGTTVSTRQMDSLPILGSSFLNVLEVAPATVPVAPTGTTYNYSAVSQNVMPSVFGQRQKDNDFLIDGVENRDPDFLGVPLYPPPAAIAEIKVDSGVGSSVYGHGSGAAVNVVTKSGTNEWHGEGWEFFRNNVLEARSFFLASLGPYRWNQFGVALGGPLVIPHLLSKDKQWFVFGYYEGVRIRNASNYTGFLPTPANIAGNFAGSAPIYDPFTTTTASNGAQARSPYSGNIIPTSELNPASVALSKALFPAPNLAAGVIPGVNYLNPGGSSTNADQWNGRVDHQFGQRDNFFARYSGALNSNQTIGLPTLVTAGGVYVHNATVSDTHVLSPTFVVTGRYGLGDNNYHSATQPPAGLNEAVGLGAAFGSINGQNLVPSLSIPGYVGPGFGGDWILSHQNTFGGDAQKIIGGHTLEFGVGIIHTWFNDVSSTTPSVVFATTQTSNFTSSTGNSFASFLLGAPTSAQRLIGSDQDDQTTTAYGTYVQDTWRHQKLTLNLGLRYDYTTVPVNSLGLGTFDTATGQFVWDIKNPITGAPANIRRGGTPPEGHEFAPRVGVAYSLNPRTVVRASYGIFFNVFGSQYIQGPQGARGNWPFSFPQSQTAMNTGVPNLLFPNPFPGNQLVTPYYTQVLNVDQASSRTPYVHEWTFSLQHQLGQDWSIEGDYFGSRGVKLGGQIIDNTAMIPGPGPIAARQLWPQLAPYILTNFDEFNSWYQAGTLQLKKKFSQGLQLAVNYTWSKNLNDLDNLSNAGVGGAPTSNPTRFDIRKGLAGFDVPQLFVASFVWAVPGHISNRFADSVLGGWTLSGVSSYHSGLPFMVFLTTDNENIGTVSGRSTEFPNLVGNPWAVQKSVREWFNTAAFAVPAPYTIGNVGRNILRTDTQISTDLSISKQWRFWEKRSIELRGEFFNAFNHANFGYPGTQIATAQFGAVSSTLNPGRQVQLVGKIHF